jgi:hypothetical protein
MREDEIGKVLAAAAPNEVPVMTDLHHRARSMGRRKRMHRTVLTAGGTGVAVVAVAGAALAFGGRAGAPNGAVPAAAGGAKTGTSTLSTAASSPSPKGGADSGVVAAITAALPAGDTVQKAQSWGGPSKFGTTLIVTEPNGNAFRLDVVVGVADGKGEAAQCWADAKCTSGTAPLQGHQASWTYSVQSGGLPTSKPTGPTSGSTPQTQVGTDGEGLSAVDPVGGYEVVVTASGKAVPNQPTMADLKNIGLNDKVVAVLLAARG